LRVAEERARRAEFIGADGAKIGIEMSSQELFEVDGVALFFPEEQKDEDERR
jgi:hypothetical protein